MLQLMRRCWKWKNMANLSLKSPEAIHTSWSFLIHIVLFLKFIGYILHLQLKCPVKFESKVSELEVWQACPWNPPEAIYSAFSLVFRIVLFLKLEYILHLQLKCSVKFESKLSELEVWQAMIFFILYCFAAVYTTFMI